MSHKGDEENSVLILIILGICPTTLCGGFVMECVETLKPKEKEVLYKILVRKEDCVYYLEMSYDVIADANRKVVPLCCRGTKREEENDRIHITYKSCSGVCDKWKPSKENRA